MRKLAWSKQAIALNTEALRSKTAPQFARATLMLSTSVQCYLKWPGNLSALSDRRYYVQCYLKWPGNLSALSDRRFYRLRDPVNYPE